jgi:FkbM family methyltransferase
LFGLFDPTEKLTIVDAGAFDGDTAAFFLSLFPNALVHAFEPHPQSFSKLQKFKDTHILGKQISLYQNGLSAEDGYFQLTSFSSNDARSSTLKSINQDSSSIKNNYHPKENFFDYSNFDVSCITLDSWHANQISRINILKVDCQGSELDILNGGKILLETEAIDVIILEIIFDDVYVLEEKYFSKIISLLYSYDFNLYDISHVYKELALSRILWGEFVFCHRRFGESKFMGPLLRP